MRIQYLLSMRSEMAMVYTRNEVIALRAFLLGLQTSRRMTEDDQYIASCLFNQCELILKWTRLIQPSWRDVIGACLLAKICHREAQELAKRTRIPPRIRELYSLLRTVLRFVVIHITLSPAGKTAING